MSAEVFQYGKELDFEFTLLDIGGGFPGWNDSEKLFLEMVNAIKEALEKYFNKTPNIKVIAEPGIYIVSAVQKYKNYLNVSD